MENQNIEIRLSNIIGKGYKQFWNSKKRYLVVKGSRGSKKSKTSALKIVFNIMSYPLTNALIVRKVKDTLRNSCYSDIQWAISQFKCEKYWEFKKSPMEIIYKPTGQRILFRGLDDPLKLTSITVPNGIINFVWIEEAFEINKEDVFDKLDLSIRGILPNNAYFQFIITLNPWSDKHWIKKRFFDVIDEDIDALTTTYLCNEFIGTDILKQYEKMKNNNPRRYAVEGLGDWGTVDGLVFENWLEYEFDLETIRKRDNIRNVLGLDFGFSPDPLALICCLIDDNTKEIFIYDEIYKTKYTNDMLAREIKYKGYQKMLIYADCSDAKSIAELRKYGISKIQQSIKGQGSIEYGIKKVNEYKIYILPKCSNTLTEISTYCYDEKKGKPIEINNHLMDALRYAVSTEKRNKVIDVNKPIFSF